MYRGEGGAVQHVLSEFFQHILGKTEIQVNENISVIDTFAGFCSKHLCTVAVLYLKSLPKITGTSPTFAIRLQCIH